MSEELDLTWQERRRIFTRVAVLLLGLAALPVLLLVMRVNAKNHLEKRISEEIETSRRAGEPITADDFTKLRAHIPDSENSARLYLQARSSFVEMDWPSEDEENSPLHWAVTNISPSIPIPGETQLALRTWLNSNATCFAYIREARKLTNGSFPLDLRGGLMQAPTAQLPRKAILNAMWWQAVLDAEQGNIEASLADLGDLFGIAKALRDHPYPVAHDVRGSALFGVKSALERLLSRNQLSEDQLATLESRFSDAGEDDWIKNAMFFERARVIEYYHAQEMKNFRDAIDENRLRAFLTFALVPQRNMADYLKAMRKYLNSSSWPLPDRMTDEIKLLGEGPSLRNRLTGWKLIALDWTAFTTPYAKTVCGIRLSETALAIERFRLVNQGQPPPDLKALVPQFLPTQPVGPADGKPIKYDKKGGGYALSTHYFANDASGETREELSFIVER